MVKIKNIEVPETGKESPGHSLIFRYAPGDFLLAMADQKHKETWVEKIGYPVTFLEGLPGLYGFIIPAESKGGILFALEKYLEEKEVDYVKIDSSNPQEHIDQIKESCPPLPEVPRKQWIKDIVTYKDNPPYIARKNEGEKYDVFYPSEREFEKVVADAGYQKEDLTLCPHAIKMGDAGQSFLDPFETIESALEWIGKNREAFYFLKGTEPVLKRLFPDIPEKLHPVEVEKIFGVKKPKPIERLRFPVKLLEEKEKRKIKSMSGVVRAALNIFLEKPAKEVMLRTERVYTETKLTTFSITVDIEKKLQRMSRDTGHSKTAIIIFAVEDYFEMEKKQ